MNYSKMKFLIRSDLYRHRGNTGVKELIYNLIVTPGFRYSFFLRLCRYLRDGKLVRRFLYYPLRLYLYHLHYKYGYQISVSTEIGSGFYIGNFGGIFINTKAIIGKNFNISQDVTIGQSNRGRNKGVPTIGDNVYLGSGAKVIGNIRIGNNVVIGSNCVVVNDVPDNAVVVGVPGKIISYEGSRDYVVNIDYGN